MRHLLNFLHFGKRDKKKPAQADSERSKKTNSASTLIIAGEPVPRTDKSSSASDGQAHSKRLVDVVKSKQRDRWLPPELDGPEFGGLIERRGVNTRGLMPDKYEAKPAEEHRHQQASKSGSDPSHANTPNVADGTDNLESTGMFLASLDNSAITLADSGLFKMADEPEEEPEPEENFNPYDHRR